MTKNVLFIMCDQLRWDYLSCAGHPGLDTPHLRDLLKSDEHKQMLTFLELSEHLGMGC